MPRLDVRATVRWESGPPDQVIAGTPTFQDIPMMMAFCVTDADGAEVDGLSQDSIHVGYQYAPEPHEDSLAVVSDFHRNGPSFGGNGWYSCIVNHQPTDHWLQDEVFICLTVRHTNASGGHDGGKDLTLARYRQNP